MKIAIIGAGLSGTSLYTYLKNDNHEVTLFEKARGAGGRCSTRYVNEKLIDHGTPFFKAQHKEFIEFCNLKVKEEILIRQKEYFYPVKGMNKLCSSNIDQEDFIKNTKIVSCQQHDKWCLIDDNGVSYDNFDQLIITIPTPQALELNLNLKTEIEEKLKSVQYNSIATLLLYSYTLENIMSPKLLKDTSFKKIINNSSKYNFKNFSSYVIHLNEKLTNTENFKDKNEVKNFILKKIFTSTTIDLEESFHIIPHLWRYAFVSKSIKEDYLYDTTNSIGFCGDYFNGDNLEGAYLSAKRLYENQFE